jgi:hypothetical protein
VVYPNPSTGGVVSVLPPAYPGVSNVTIRVYTTAYRLVRVETYYGVPWSALPLTLTDRRGSRFSNGLYYAFITTNAGRSMTQMMVLR